MMLAQHLMLIIKSDESVIIVQDNAKSPMKSVTEALRTKEAAAPGRSSPVAMDLPPVAPLSPSKRYREKTSAPVGLPSISLDLEITAFPPPLAPMKQRNCTPPILKQKKSLANYGCSASHTTPTPGSPYKKMSRKSASNALSRKLNVAHIKNLSRWDSGSVLSVDSVQQTLSIIAKQTMQHQQQRQQAPAKGIKRTSSMDKTHHDVASSVPLRLPRRRGSFEEATRFDTAAMIGKVLDELDLIDSDEDDDATQDTPNQMAAYSC